MRYSELGVRAAASLEVSTAAVCLGMYVYVNPERQAEACVIHSSCSVCIPVGCHCTTPSWVSEPQIRCSSVWQPCAMACVTPGNRGWPCKPPGWQSLYCRGGYRITDALVSEDVTFPKGGGSCARRHKRKNRAKRINKIRAKE